MQKDQICQNCWHSEINYDYDGSFYCYYWDYEQGISPNRVTGDDFCSNWKKKKEEQKEYFMRENDFYSIDGVIELPSTVDFEEFHDKFMSFLEGNKYLFSGTLGKWMGDPPKHFTEEEFEEEFGCDND